MKKFIVKEDFWEVFPKAKIAVITIKNVDNRVLTETDYYKNILDEAFVESKQFVQNENFSENEVIQKWRKAYQQFKTKKGVRSSIESLLKRISGNNPVGTINPMVDLYNSISLRFGVPCGGEDIDNIVGDMLLTKANGDEEFITLGSEKSEPPYESEIVYKDEAGAICRCLNWRESVRTMLTDDTKNAVFVIEEVEAEGSSIELAANELVRLFKETFKVEPTLEFLDVNNQETVIG
ncbi:B3/B4 domain-containing protein [[Acholeplasma] multilocale]|uniref:B3/B4 domain-containing protein n=1 Tax=[Acholeplasma] multilocale TaxID=264638 RepID=UPI00047BDCAE|nr:phenylalanine--tRNA ligase beta subunit-related protein [[Acholeplasma] multilocale]